MWCRFKKSRFSKMSSFFSVAALLLVTQTAFSKASLFTQQRSIIDAIESRKSILLCELTVANPDDYFVTWLYEGDEIVNNQRRFVEEGKLFIQKVNRSLDSGSFQCKATLKNDTSKFNLNFPVKLNIKWIEINNIVLKSPPSKSGIYPGVDVSLKCGIDGKPRPRNVTWLLNNAFIQANETVIISKSRLTLRNVKLQLLDGSYNCCAVYMNKLRCSTDLYHLNVIDVSKPVLVKRPPEKVFAAKGSVVQLDCVFTAQPKPKIIWTTEDSKQLTNKSKQGECRRRCIYPNGTLILRSFRAGQADRYICSAIQLDKTAVSVDTQVVLATISHFKLSEKTENLEIGRNFEYVCNDVESNPPNELTWMKDGKVIDPTGHVSQFDSMLVIDHAKQSDAGVYTCIRKNIAGSVMFNLTLKFPVPPVVGVLESKRCDEGQNVTWSCPIQSQPFPSVIWYKDEVKLTSSIRMILSKGDLTIVNVVKSDEGSYYCKAINFAAEGNSNKARLFVAENLKFFPPLEDVCIKSEGMSFVTCGVSGANSPNIIWRQIGGGEMPETVLNGSSLSLVFKNPTHSQSGEFECQVTEDESISVSLSKRIQINVVDLPVIIKSPHDETAYDGDTVKLPCTSADNSGQVVWKHGEHIYRYSSVQPFSQFKVMPNGTLELPHVTMSDAGMYTCSYQVCEFIVSASATLQVFPQKSDEITPTDNRTPSGGNTNQLIQTIALSVSGGIAYVLITVALIVYFRGRHRKKRSNKATAEEERMLNGSSRNGHLHSNHNDDDIMMENGIPMSVLSHLDPDIENLQYPSSNIEAVTVIGKGEFGEIFLSKAPGLFPHLEEDILVMVKTLDTQNENSDVMEAYRSEFNHEINALHKCNHDNVVKLLAISGKSSSYLKPDCLITEYLEWGILKLCLQASKQGTIPKFTKQNKMSICCQIACGLEHLAKHGLVHKDIATRNCVVSSQLLVKISMLGLSVEGFENEYVKHDGRLLPVRWMAPESISHYQFSSQSDVWSFAVTCWEIFNLGRFPYDHLTDEEYIKSSKQGEPAALPPLEGSKRFTSLITKCCQISPTNRPDIKQITKKLQTITGEGELPQTVQADVTNDREDE
uniref:Tyrosine-protein kinase-like otk n=1 Tax=Phallusia mammillata TaxID=59560 RepID=A0A6F9DQ12_9ASCI|nr:inactive tyrosine-protein kinase 7-like [Phallusia mammillata]